MWFDPRFSGIVGGIMDSSIGVLGGVWGTMAGLLSRKGKHKRLVLSYAIVLITIGVTSLFTGVFALIMQQPYHVWYPFLFPGLILTSVLIPKYLSIKRIYAKAELYNLHFDDIT